MAHIRASWRSIACVFYLFSHLSSFAIVVRKPAPTESELDVPSGSVIRPSVSIITPAPIASPISLSAPTADSSFRSSVNKTIVAASVSIGVSGAVILVVFLVLFTRRRRELKRTQRPETPKEICNPFDSEAVSDVDPAFWVSHLDRFQTGERGSTHSSSDVVSTRQLYISNQVNNARQKLAELEEISIHLRSSSINSARVSSWRSVSGIDHDANPVPSAAAEENESANVDDPESFGVEDKLLLERALREIEELNNRIRELEMQRRSSWALGLSDEPPPGYSESA
ncbi:hypothetical protein MVEN_00577700 [Mycena venus]|uniref:Transmembrane protein n=1 Tax=Mycena venus TaxID=2733690 RepID=A0A8H6YP82_9AGAR|nr:hypothetical protein MVEN_00577700 [Mycena venus]